MTRRELILSALADGEKSFAVLLEVVTTAGFSKNSLPEFLNELTKSGAIVRVSYGRYALPENAPLPRENVPAAVLRALDAMDDSNGRSLDEICTAIGRKRATVQQAISMLVRKGEILRLARGRYRYFRPYPDGNALWPLGSFGISLLERLDKAPIAADGLDAETTKALEWMGLIGLTEQVWLGRQIYRYKDSINSRLIQSTMREAGFKPAPTMADLLA